MAIVKYNEDFFGPFFTRMPSMFEDFDSLLPTGSKKSGEMLEVSEDKSKVYVTAAVPGVNCSDVDVTVKGNQLTVKAEVKEEKEEKKGKKVVYSSKMQKNFYYSTTLPSEVSAKSAKATVKNGILSLELDKVTEAGTKVKVVDVK